MPLWTLEYVYIFELVFLFSVGWKTSILYSTVATPIYIPTNILWRSWKFLNIELNLFHNAKQGKIQNSAIKYLYESFKCEKSNASIKIFLRSVQMKSGFLSIYY